MAADSWFRVLSGILKFIAGWVAPLAILAFEFTFALQLRRATRERATRVSATAGLIVGLALWVYLVFRYPPRELMSVFPSPSGFWRQAMVIGLSFLGGLGLVPLVQRYAQRPAVGILILILSFSSLAAAYSYIFASESRDVLFTAAIFVLVGAGVHVILRPERSAGVFFRGGSESASAKKSAPDNDQARGT